MSNDDLFGDLDLTPEEIQAMCDNTSPPNTPTRTNSQNIDRKPAAKIINPYAKRKLSFSPSYQSPPKMKRNWSPNPMPSSPRYRSYHPSLHIPPERTSPKILPIIQRFPHARIKIIQDGFPRAIVAFTETKEELDSLTKYILRYVAKRFDNSNRDRRVYTSTPESLHHRLQQRQKREGWGGFCSIKHHKNRSHQNKLAEFQLMNLKKVANRPARVKPSE